MKKVALFGLLVLVFATPAMAHPHHSSDLHISSMAFMAYLFAGIACAVAMLWGGFLSRSVALIALAGPVFWGLCMIATGHGMWSYEHYAAHHNAASYVGLMLALIVFGMVDWKLATEQIAKQ